MVKNQYLTKGYVSQALMHQHSMVVPPKYIKVVSNFNGVDYALVQRWNHVTHEITFHTFTIENTFWYSDNKSKVNPITLIKQ
jgi:hypothetical protein